MVRREPGHRARGAGTVSVSKGDTLRQGILCKEWQRTPMQLLHDYCQSKKRRGAYYARAKTKDVAKFRMRCVLPDVKNSEKDLSFCPEQEFKTQDEAKHCAALLALKHVEPLRPLERKLPDPYRELWLALGSIESKLEFRTKGKGKNKTKNEVIKSKTEETKIKNEVDEIKTEELDFWTDGDNEEGYEEKKNLPVKLTMDRKFASYKEFEAAKLARTQEKNKKLRSRENRERANLPCQVMMSASCRELIEEILKTLGQMQTRTLQVDENLDFISEQKQVEDVEFQKKIIQRLKAFGFTLTQIQEVLENCPRDSSVSDDDYMSIIFDWLCLNIPERELPKMFNPEGTQLDVVLSTSSSGSAESARTAVLVQRLMKFGYDHHDVVLVVNEFVKENPGISEEELKTPSLVTLFALLEKLFPYVKKHFSLEEIDGAVEAPSDEEELLNQRQDEFFALKAIYDEKLKITTLENGSNAQLLTFEVTDALRLYIYLPRTSKYPFELPLVALTSTEAKHQPHLLATCGEALRSCVHSMGDPMLYDIYVAIDTYVQDKKRLSMRPSRVQLLKKFVAVEETGTATSSRTGGQKDDNVKSRKTKNGRGGNHSKNLNHYQPKRVDVDAVRRTSENLLKSRKAKDGQRDFQQMLATRAKLPAGKEEAQVIKCVQNNQVVLICGATGCGKTTQIPQFILDEYVNRGAGGECNIICTQPRRIAAIGVATRVAQERCEDIADIVGYQIRMDAKKSSNTRLLFCTTGVLLRRLLNDRQLSGVSHVIVDEVHERNVDTDFLLSILRDLLPQRPDLRVILMSATMNSELFVKYFSSVTRTPCPVLDIPGFTYPVECNFLEEIIDQTYYAVPKYLLKKKKTKKEGGDGEDAEEKSLAELTPEEIAARVDDSKIDYDLIVHLVRFLVLDKAQNAGTANGAILVFLPGTAEIKRLVEMLTHGNGGLSSKLWALPLHGSLSGADQATVFKSAPAGKTKVIVSTNIAETSITINDITAVIDSGKVKEMVYDNHARRSQLLDCWAARAACDQRKGRAGRVQAGTCYRLFSRKRFAAMDAQLSAEIHRVSLEQLCLQIKKLEFGSIKGFLSKAIEPPAEDAIDAAIQELVDIAAFRIVSPKKKLHDGIKSVDDEEVVLTPLGNHLAMLPLDARIGKFLVYGSILRCIQPVAIIAACISSRNPFLMSMSDPEMRAKQDALKKELGGSWKSDHLLLWKLVERYVPLRGQKMKREFCRDIGLSYDTMESILDLKQQYLQQLDNIGFYEARNADNLNENSNAPRIIKAALCAGLYANVAQVVYPEQKYFQSAHGVVEEDHNAKQIRYFVRSTTETGQRERVFLHPSSCNFTQTNYDSPWLLYTELVQTSKIFVRESTMVNPYALLLFGGQLEVIHEKNLLTLDGFIRFNAVARIGVLIKSIRQHLDRLLMEKIADPSVDIAQSQLVTAISHLLKSEGMYAGA